MTVVITVLSGLDYFFGLRRRLGESADTVPTREA